MRKEERGYKIIVTLSDQNFLSSPSLPLTSLIFGLVVPTSVFLSFSLEMNALAYAFIARGGMDFRSVFALHSLYALYTLLTMKGSLKISSVSQSKPIYGYIFADVCFFFKQDLLKVSKKSKRK